MDNIKNISTAYLYPDGHTEFGETSVISEHYLTVIINERPAYRLVCTKSDLKELLVGRLYTDGWIDDTDDIVDIFFCRYEKEASVFLKDTAALKENIITEQTCCAGNRTYAIPGRSRVLNRLPECNIDHDRIFKMADEFRKDSKLHCQTGGSHSCMLAKEDQLIYRCEDIGRHNTIDKAVGYSLLNNIPLDKCMLYTSGRVPVDMAEKVIAAGIPVLISKSVPTLQSIELAKEYGLNLICRAWPDKCEIY